MSAENVAECDSKSLLAAKGEAYKGFLRNLDPSAANKVLQTEVQHASEYLSICEVWPVSVISIASEEEWYMQQLPADIGFNAVSYATPPAAFIQGVTPNLSVENVIRKPDSARLKFLADSSSAGGCSGRVDVVFIAFSELIWHIVPAESQREHVPFKAATLAGVFANIAAAASAKSISIVCYEDGMEDTNKVMMEGEAAYMHKVRLHTARGLVHAAQEDTRVVRVTDMAADNGLTVTVVNWSEMEPMFTAETFQSPRAVREGMPANLFR